MSAKMKKLFQQVHKIPQVPEVVRLLISQFNDPNIDLKAIAGNVEKEQVIALKVLRLVNSAAFGLPKKIASIEDAVVLLGMAKLRSLVIASGIVSSVSDIENFDVKQFWLDSFSTANYAKYLAAEVKCDENIAFTAGLISDLGRVLIHMGLAKESAEIEKRVNEGHARPYIEKMRIGFTGQDVCAELCRIWKFSDELTIPVEQCGEPLIAEPVSKLACVVYLARHLSHCLKLQMTEEDILSGIPVEVVAELGLPASFFNENLTELLAMESGLDGLLD